MSRLPVKNPRLLQDISQVNVCIEKVRVQSDSLLEVMNR